MCKFWVQVGSLSLVFHFWWERDLSNQKPSILCQTSLCTGSNLCLLCFRGQCQQPPSHGNCDLKHCHNRRGFSVGDDRRLRGGLRHHCGQDLGFWSAADLAHPSGESINPPSTCRQRSKAGEKSQNCLPADDEKQQRLARREIRGRLM